MKLPPMLGSLVLMTVVTGPVHAVTAGSAPGAASDAASKAQLLRRADAYAMEARFLRAAGKPAAAFLARRAAALSDEYRRRALTGPRTVDQDPST